MTETEEQIVQETDTILGKGHGDGYYVFSIDGSVWLNVSNALMKPGVSGYVAFPREEALDICRTILSVAGLDNEVRVVDCDQALIENPTHSMPLPEPIKHCG